MMLLSQLSQVQLDSFSQFLLASGLGVLSLVLLLLKRWQAPACDPREPPMLWPKIPYIGHLISTHWEGGAYYERLYKSKHMPICTISALGEKRYILNSPDLIASAMRATTLSLDTLPVIFLKNALAVSEAELRRFDDPAYIAALRKVVYRSMVGEPLRQTVRATLRYVAADLDQLGFGGGVVEVPRVTDWLQDFLSFVIMRGLYGSRNPITREGLRDVWVFDDNINALIMNLAPRLLAPKGVAARTRIQAALKKFYEAGYDQGDDVSPFVKNRAAVKREMGADATDLSLGEAEVPWGPLANTVPSFIWFFLNVFARPDYLERVRRETAEVTRIEGDSAIIDVGKLIRQPFIKAVGQEVQRLYNKQCTFREVMEDTVLQDAEGREYLIKKGAGLQWFIAVRHMDGAAWGPDVKAFNPDRFLNPEPDQERNQKGSMMPFGGGRHLCPGRRLAVTNATSTVCAMALLFDVEGVTVPPWRPGAAICSIARPTWEGGKQSTARFRRREGWEKMRVKFEVGSNDS